MQSDFPSLEHWHWLRFCIRSGLVGGQGESMFHRLYAENQTLIHRGQLCCWHAQEATLRLFMECAADRGLSWAWRQQCLEQACRPLNILERLAVSEQRKRCVAIWSRQLAKTGLAPSLPLYSRLGQLPGGSPPR